MVAKVETIRKKIKQGKKLGFSERARAVNKGLLPSRQRMAKKRDPKKGTGKKPKGSGRRLYTDENPKDTVSIKFATPADARTTVAKVRRVNKPYARKIQILTVMEQRAKVMGKTKVVSIAKKAKQSLKRKHDAKQTKR